MSTKAIAPSNYFFDSLAKAFARNLYKNETLDKKNLNSLGFVRRNLIKATKTPGTCLGWSSLLVSALSSVFLLPSLIRDYGSNSFWESVKKAFIPVLSLLGTIGSFILNSSGTNRVEETVMNESNNNIEIANKIIQNIKANEKAMNLLIFNDELTTNKSNELDLAEGTSHAIVLKNAGFYVNMSNVLGEKTNYLITSCDPKDQICEKYTTNGEERYFGLMFNLVEGGEIVNKMRENSERRVILYSMPKSDYSRESPIKAEHVENVFLGQSIATIFKNGFEKRTKNNDGSEADNNNRKIA